MFVSACPRLAAFSNNPVVLTICDVSNARGVMLTRDVFPILVLASRYLVHSTLFISSFQGLQAGIATYGHLRHPLTPPHCPSMSALIQG